MVRKYLKHREDRQRQEWAQGSTWTPESRVLVQTLSDIEALEFDDIAEWYGWAAPMEAADGAITSVTIPDVELRLYPEEDDERDVEN